MKQNNGNPDEYIGCVLNKGFINNFMKLGLWRGKRTLKQWELDRQQDGHHERLKNIRPTSCELDWEPLTLNPNKRLMKQ